MLDIGRPIGRSLAALMIVALCPQFAQQLTRSRGAQNANSPKLLSFDELVTLSETDRPPVRLHEKLDNLLSTPFMGREAITGAVQPHAPEDEGLGPVLRVAFWNIERGFEFDLIRLAFSQPGSFKQAALTRGSIPAKRLEKIDEQLRTLRESDVIVLNEVDLGMKRTDYRNVAKDLAHALRMNYAFGVEFVEVDRLEDLGIDSVELDDKTLAQRLNEEFKPDRTRYLGLHGSAILSHYPIENVRIYSLPVCHDWYGTEKAEISKLEKAKRFTANKVFLERIEREVRRGGRMAIIADIKLPFLSAGSATVVAVHLETNASLAAARSRWVRFCLRSRG